MNAAKSGGKSCTFTASYPRAGAQPSRTPLRARRNGESARSRQCIYHAFTDGRDAPHFGRGFLEELQGKLDELNSAKSLPSRADITPWTATTTGTARKRRTICSLWAKACALKGSAADAAKASYASGVTDEFILPTNLTENGAPVALIGKGDSIVCFNFRPDRARQITRMFSQEQFPLRTPRRA
ncbi:MAG: hypothetical protein ACLS4Z_01080 [Christensenellaceae bacterium]